MNQYLISYFGGEPPKTPEAGQEHFKQYKAWLANLGDEVISPMNPLKNANSIQPDGAVSEGSRTNLSGFTIVKAENIQAALDMAKACPFLNIGGSLEVAQLVDMNTNSQAAN